MAGTWFFGGRSPYPGQEEQSVSIYCEEGKIRAAGTDRELELLLSGKNAARVDLDGGYVLPGLADCHMHLSMQGMKLAALDFSGAASKEEMLRLLKQRADATPPGEWILGLNWNENAFRPAVAPTRDELDAVTTRHPVLLTRVCYHSWLANTEAFRRAGVGEAAVDSASGGYGRDEAGRLNGRIYEDAGLAFQAAVPEPDYAEKKACIRRAAQYALSLGLTAVHTDDLRFLGDVDTMLRIYRELRQEGVLLRTHQLVYYPHLAEAKAMGLQAGSGGEWLRIGAAKVFADGVLGGRTAWLSEPYADAPGQSGYPIHTPVAFAAIVRAARAAGFPVAVHAIGDAAVDLVLAELERQPLPAAAGLPDRLIHVPVLRDDQLVRMGRLRLAADIQPPFVTGDYPWVLERLGQRAVHRYAWRTLLSAGIPCGGSSDAPIEPPSPLYGLYTAVARRRPGEAHPGYEPGERLTLAEAVRLYTYGSAQTAGEEGERGLLAPGYGADFTVVDRPFADGPEEWLRMKVRRTVVNGQTAYEGDR
ncbi:amidohydrolase [Paenibacillus sp. YN15]|uniref:amidohydrolase n=1 Tax=Paenibacillus sp. YN15 TaxID=1742774 RepID=UPI000DCE75E5|nr:amidohydrolase [Paenibacillus sp. YN15]RAV00237.1 amidohydrolase [Paenibacillus sp. YN15]